MRSRWTAFFWFHDPSIVLRFREQSTDESNQLTTLFASEDGSFVGQWYLGSAIRSFYPTFFSTPPNMAKLGNDHAMLVVFSHRAWDPCPAHAEEAQLYHVGVSPSLFEFWASKEASNHEKNQPGEANIKRKPSDCWSTNQTTKHGNIVYFNKNHRSQWSQHSKWIDKLMLMKQTCFWFIACDFPGWLHLRAPALA